MILVMERENLDEKLLQSTFKFRQVIFQLDNDPKHRTKILKEWLEDHLSGPDRARSTF